MKVRVRAIKLRILEIAVFLLLVVATAWLFRYLTDEITLRMETLKSSLIAVLEQQVNGRIHYGSISPSMLMFLDVEDVTIRPTDRPEDTLLRLNRLQIRYNILKLFTEADPISAISEIIIRNTVFNLDWERDKEVIEILDRLFFSAPPQFYSVRITGAALTLNLVYRGFELRARDVFFQFGTEQDTYFLNLRRARLEATLPLASGGREKIQCDVKLKARLNESIEWIDSQMRIISLSSRFLSLGRQTFQISLEDGQLDVVKIQDKSPVDLQLSWDLEKQEWELAFKADRLNPANLVAFTGEWAYLNPWLKARITADGTVRYSLKNGEISYRANADAYLFHRALPPGFHAVSALRGDDRKIRFDDLFIESERGAARFAGDVDLANLMPQGSLRLIDVKPLDDLKINALLLIERLGGGLSVFASRVDWAGMQGTPLTVLGETHLELQLHENRALFSLTTSFENAASENALSSVGEIVFGERPALKLDCVVRDIPVATLQTVLSSLPILQKIDLPPFVPRLKLSTRLLLETDFSDVALDCPYLTLVDIDRPDNQVLLSLTAENGNISLADMNAVWDGFRFRGNLDLQLFSREHIDFHASFSIQGYDYQIDGRYRESRALEFSGNYGIAGYLRKERHGLSFSLVTMDLPVPIQDPPLLASVNLSGSKAGDSVWLITSTDSKIRRLPIFESGENELDLSFYLVDSHLSLTRIYYEDEVSAVEGTGTGTVDYPRTYSANIELRNARSEEAYSLSISLEEENVRAKAFFRQSPLARLGSVVITGSVDGELAATGTFRDPTIDIRAKLVNGKLAADPIELDAELHYARRRFSLDSLTLTYLDNRVRDGRGLLDFNTGRFELTCRFDTEFLSSLIGLDFELKGVFEADESDFFRDPLAYAIEAQAELTHITIDEHASPSWGVAFHTRELTLFFEGGPENSVRGSFSPYRDVGGNETPAALRHERRRVYPRRSPAYSFKLDLSEPFPITGSILGRLEADTIDAQCRNLAIDFPLLSVFMEDSIFQFLDGKAVGNLTISGLLTDPQFHGRLDALGVRMSYYMAPDVSEKFNTKILLRNKELYYGVATTRAGLADISSEGTITFSHWLPTEYDLKFWTRDQVGLHLVHDFGSVKGDGYATGDLRVWGDWLNTWIEGSLQINYCTITLSQTRRSSGDNPYGESNYYVDMKLESGKSVEFLWPSVEFPVLNTLAERGAKMAVAFRSDTSEMLIAGEVGLRGGEVYYFNRSFYIRDGTIRFNETGALFDPRVTIRAEIRERDESGEEVKIFLVSENDRLSEFAPHFISEPNRSDVEILALLGGAIQEPMREGGLGMSALLLSADLLSQFGILRPFEQGVREALGLDLFSIRTQLIQNVIIDGVLGLDVGAISYGQATPGDYLDNTTISLGKYIGEDLFLETVLRFIGGSNAPLQLELFISLEWPTPFFNLEWTVAPKLDSVDELFYRHSTLTFKWIYSY